MKTKEIDFADAVEANKESHFRVELEDLINGHCKENGSNTPDFILADYLSDCLKAFDRAVNRRSRWYTSNVFSHGVESIERSGEK